MENKIDITGLNKAEVLAALYNASRQQGMGFLHSCGRSPMTIEDAAAELKQSEYFDYLHGRVMKISLAGNELRTALYDRDNGQGAAKAALSHLLA